MCTTNAYRVTQDPMPTTAARTRLVPVLRLVVVVVLLPLLILGESGA